MAEWKGTELEEDPESFGWTMLLTTATNVAGESWRLHTWPWTDSVGGLTYGCHSVPRHCHDNNNNNNKYVTDMRVGLKSRSQSLSHEAANMQVTVSIERNSVADNEIVYFKFT